MGHEVGGLHGAAHGEREVVAGGQVHAVEKADLGGLGQPVLAGPDDALHELGRHDGGGERGAEELVPAEGVVEGLLVDDDGGDLRLADGITNVLHN